MNSYEIKNEDIQCFSKVTMFYFLNGNVSYDFLIKPPPALYYVSLFNCSTDYIQLFSSPINSNITSLIIRKVPVSINISIKFSTINNIDLFFFELQTIEGVSKVQLINDLPVNGKIYKIPEIHMNNLYDFPNMDNIGCSLFSIGSFKEPTGGYSNIQTFRNVESITISGNFTIDFNMFTLIPKNNTLKSLSVSVKDLTTSILFNLSNLTLLQDLHVLSSLKNFSIGGKIPLVLPQSLQTLYFSGGGQFSGVGEFLSNYPNLLYITLNKNNLTGNFSEWKNYGYSQLRIENNNLQGTIDSSWCNTLLNVSNNQLSGQLPSCFTCHMQSVSVKSMFSGNSFTNINSPPICTTLIPNFRRLQFIELYGQDLGYNAYDIIPSPYFDLSYRSPTLFSSFSNIFLPQIINITFNGAKQTFSLSTTQKAPLVIKITPTINTKQLTFDGSFFNYNKSSFNILVDSYKCKVDSSIFNQVNCTIESSTYNKNTISIITINVNDYFYNNLTILTTTVFAYLNQTSSVKNCTSDCISPYRGVCNTLIGQCYFYCPNNCTDPTKGTCDTLTGKCLCNSNFQGNDCSLPFIACKSDCSLNLNQGICNNQTGVCNCTFGYQGENCSLQIKSCPNNCTDGGTCDTITGVCNCSPNRIFSDCSGYNCTNTCEHSSTCDTTKGVCICVPNYQGEYCSIPSHYISSIIPCSTDGGEVSIAGWFGDDEDATHTLSYYSVIIGQLECIVTSINKTTIKCNLGSGKGTKTIKIINKKYTNVIFIGNGLFSYQNQIKTCPNNCTSTNNGNCNTNIGECQCNDKFSGFDCSNLISPSTNSSVNNNTGDVILNNQDTTYKISIISLNEISFDGSIIISHTLNRNWSIDSNNKEINTFKFSQSLINNTCIITYVIEEINENKKITFGTTTFTLEKDSIKLTILIKNYQYQSSLNTLQLVFYSAATDTDSANNNNNECNKKESSIDTSEVNNQQVSNYIQISKNSKILVGRFINQVISDSRPTFMSSTIISDNNNSSIKLGLNLPHCNECLIDPDFSILVSPDFKESCNDESNKNWLIPVVVVVPVIGCALILVVVVIIIKKNRFNIKIIAFKLKPLKNKQQI
ncbi:hypothetical protein RB653_009827 [Dictyostelium firmibasis]|uniref:EGF-like domain-containing protein n=1 Tax=Dictyostelium firmibasis TaxID=79012 RepID=A0AAN7TKM4_9MYCE